jgi:hypothetical protein
MLRLSSWCVHAQEQIVVRADEPEDESDYTASSPASLWRCAVTLMEALADELSERIAKRIELRPIQKRLLEIEEAAHYIGRTSNALRILERKGQIRATRTDGRVMFDVKDLDSWIDSGK